MQPFTLRHCTQKQQNTLATIDEVIFSSLSIFRIMHDTYSIFRLKYFRDDMNAANLYGLWNTRCNMFSIKFCKLRTVFIVL